jgi:hypothetical protein
MTVWEWECFTAVLEGPGFRVADAGPLEAPVRSFTLKRDAKRNLMLETVAVGETRNTAVDHPPGTVRRTTEFVSFESEFGPKAIAHGVSRTNRSRGRNADGQAECREVWSVQRLEVMAGNESEPAFILDWLENLDSYGHWMGEMIRTKSRTPQTRTIGSGETAVTLSSRGFGKDSSSHAALELEIGGVRLFLCSELHMPERTHPGYILYCGAPDEELRKRIRNILGFCLGCGLVYLGSTVLDAKSQLISTSAVSGNPLGDRIFDVAQRPPAPLGTRYEHEVDQHMLSRMAAAIYDHYDELDFGALSWAYWHAVAAPVHIAAAHFGAAIEGLQAAYKKAHPKDTRGKIIFDKAKAKAIKAAFAEAAAGTALEPETRKAIDDKIANINSASGAVVSERVMGELNLQLGPDEKAAWLRRNDAAHGKPPSEDEIIPLIRDTKLLRLVLNRMVLRIANASPTYIDDYTVGHAVRALAQSVPSRAPSV